MTDQMYNLNRYREVQGNVRAARVLRDRTSSDAPLLNERWTRYAYAMFVHGGKRTDEIADALGFPEAAVANSLARYKERLRLDEALHQELAT